MAWVSADIAQLGLEHLGPSLWNGFTRLVIFVGAAILVADRRRAGLELEQKASRAIDDWEAARELAVTDPLTGLFNRNLLLQQGFVVNGAAWPDGGPYSVIALDLDDLKPLNDTLGHEAGDRALSGVSPS